MLLRATIILLFASCRCEERLQPVDNCGQPCGETKTAGACRPGYWECDGGEPACVGAISPTPETCDTLDNDCDGTPDNVILSCDNACGPGVRTTCSGVCSAPTPGLEVCNGRDDDCDGLKDNNVPLTFCYTGPDATVGQGECKPGYTVCVQGVTRCAGQTLPRAESCNGRDDDCDGYTDEGVTDYGKLDMVFLVDNSGSMAPFVANLKSQTSVWLGSNWAMDLHVGLVGIPPMHGPAGPEVILDMTDDLNEFTRLLNEQDGWSGTGNEPNLEAVNQITQGLLPLAWRNDAVRVIVVYSDEEPQLYGTPTLPWPGWNVQVFTSPGYATSTWSAIPVDKIWDISTMDYMNLETISAARVCE